MTHILCKLGAVNRTEAGADVATATQVWQRRCELVLDQLAAYPCFRPRRLVAAARRPQHGPCPRGSIPAAVHPRPGRRHTNGWLGSGGSRYLRLVFANEPAERLSDLRTRLDTALR